MEGSKGVFKKKNRRPWKVTCEMCDVSFFGSIYAHRANHAHQTLKNFLHSSCGICKENFRMKINHDHHRLSAGHIKVGLKLRLCDTLFQYKTEMCLLILSYQYPVSGKTINRNQKKSIVKIVLTSFDKCTLIQTCNTTNRA